MEIYNPKITYTEGTPAKWQDKRKLTDTEAQYTIRSDANMVTSILINIYNLIV